MFQQKKPARPHRAQGSRVYTRSHGVRTLREGRRSARRLRRRLRVASGSTGRHVGRPGAGHRGGQPARPSTSPRLRLHPAEGGQRGPQDHPRSLRRPQARQAEGHAPFGASTTSRRTSRRSSSSATTPTPSQVQVRVDTQEKTFRVDDVVGPWDVSSHLRDVFAFLQDGLRGTDVDLRDVEYAACNGMLHTLDPHSVLLSPDAYKEMNLSTQGQFGGLGIVISIRDQQLTVMNPMPGTPAGRGGAQEVRPHRQDQQRVHAQHGAQRGRQPLARRARARRSRCGSIATVPTAGQGSARSSSRARSSTSPRSSTSCSTANIGYVRLKQFQANTHDRPAGRAGRHEEERASSRALVLDLRGNPGGLLDQAAKVVDTFVSDGPIVATVGNPSEGREEKDAHGEGTEPNYPLAVLVNGASASASEIVTGALKNHDRAVIVGETTFGKGSVQLVFTDLPDKAALKLTIAQYLTEPGDVSIQGVGVTPDIELDPMTVDPLEMDLTADTGGIKERDLSRALSNVRAKEGGRPAEVVQVRLADEGPPRAARPRRRSRRQLRARLPDPVRPRNSAARSAGQAHRAGAAGQGSSSPTRARPRSTRSPTS